MTTLYVLEDIRERVLYVGIPRAAISRLAHHASEKSWWSEVASTEFHHYPTRQKAMEAERTLIQALRPPYNIELNPRAGVVVERVNPDDVCPGQPPDEFSAEESYRLVGMLAARFEGMCGNLPWPRCECGSCLSEDGDCYMECGLA